MVNSAGRRVEPIAELLFEDISTQVKHSLLISSGLNKMTNVIGRQKAKKRMGGFGG